MKYWSIRFLLFFKPMGLCLMSPLVPGDCGKQDGMGVKARLNVCVHVECGCTFPRWDPRPGGHLNFFGSGQLPHKATLAEPSSWERAGPTPLLAVC